MSGAPVSLSKEDLRNYQIRGIRFVLLKRYCALFIDMGLGKTIIVLTAIAKLLRVGKIESVLIVAPLRVVYTVWRQEAKLWQHTKRIKFSLVHGNHREKIAALNRPAHVYLINIDGLRWLDDIYGKRRVWPFDMLVLDESSMVKKVTTVRFKILRRRVKGFTRRVVMTGTPTPNGLHEIWPQLYIADRGYHLGTTYTDFKANYFNKGGYMGYKLIAQDDALERVTQESSPIVMRLDSEDWLDLPKLITVPIWVDLPPDARAVYDELEREMFYAWEETGTFVDNPHAAALRGRCAQLAGGAVYAEHEGTAAKVWQPVHTAKMDAFEEIVDELQGEPIMGIYAYKHELIRLRKQFKTYDVIGSETKTKGENSELERLVKKWNKRQSDGLLVHPASVGHGLNLQYGGRHFAWFTLTDSLELYEQLLKRLHRSGQKESVMNYILLARDTVDEVKYGDIQAKAERQTRVNNSYREHTFADYAARRRNKATAQTVTFRETDV